MIDRALEVLRIDIRDYIRRLPDLNPDNREFVQLTHIVKHEDGNVAIDANSLGLSLVSIEEERVTKSQDSIVRAPNGQVSFINPEIKLNLYILITAFFTNYNEGLKYLSGAIRFFQSKNVFNQENTPSLDSRIQKLIVELYTLNFEQQNHLWGSLGAKYLPSVMYKVRLIIIQEAQKSSEQPPIREINYLERRI